MRVTPDSVASFRRLEGPGAVVIVAEAYSAEIEPLGLTGPGSLEDWLRGGATPVAGGRARGWRIELPESRRVIHLRELAHGGWLRRLTGRRFLRLRRALRGLEAAEALGRLGVEVPAPVLLRGVRHGLFWHVELANEFIDGCVSGGAFLEENDGEVATIATAREAGRVVRSFHDAGASHPDLHADNLLVRLGGPAAVLVTDLEGVRIGPPPDPRRRMRELMRLYRSLAKRQLAEDHLQRSAAAFFAGYVAGDRPLRAALLRHGGTEARRLALHQLAYAQEPR